MAADPANRQKVKSVQDAGAEPADQHERAKDFLSPGQVAKLLDAAKAGRHGLRVSEATGLRRDELDLDRARLWVRRLKGGLFVEQPIAGDELRTIKRHVATRTDALPWLFTSERGQPLTRQAVNYLVATAAARAGLRGCIRTPCATRAAMPCPTRGTISSLSRTTLATATPATPSITPAQQGDASRDCGGEAKIASLHSVAVTQ